MTDAVLNLLINILNLYTFVIIGMVIMSWLKAFGIANMRNPVIAQIDQVFTALTEPILRPIRNILPSMGGIDLSPVVLIFGIMFLQNLLINFARGNYI